MAIRDTTVHTPRALLFKFFIFERNKEFFIMLRSFIYGGIIPV